jgi:hypothetical protein
MTSHIRATHPPDLDCGPYGCNVCNLFICSVCGGAEGSLASECPGVQLTTEQQDEIYAGTLDFKNGEWVRSK